jgi:hypothetical protein
VEFGDTISVGKHFTGNGDNMGEIGLVSQDYVTV